MTSSDGLTRTLDGLLDVVVWALAAWTIAYHLAVAADLTQRAAFVTWAAVVIAALVLRIAAGRVRPPTLAPWTVRPEISALTVAGVVAAAGAAVFVGSSVRTGSGWWLFWLLAAVSLIIGGLLAWKPAPPDHPEPSWSATGPATSARAVLVVVAVAVAFAGLSLFTRRADSDDSFLVNRSLYTEQRAERFATGDTMFADEVFESSRPEVTPTSFEPLIGGVARGSGLTSSTLTYLAVGPVVAALGILAVWRLARTLRLRAAELVTAGAAVFLLLDGVRHQSFGNFSFARSWQGKVVLVALLVPLLWHYGLSAGREERDRLSVAGLIAANIAAVGLSSTGIIVAPAITVLGVASGVGARWSRRLWVIPVAVAYPVGALLVGSELDAVVESAAPAGANGAIVAAIITAVGAGASLPWYLVLGTGIPAAIASICALSSWAAVSDPVARRALVAAPAAVLVLLGPFVFDAANDALRVDNVYWRVMWIMPLPLMVGIVATVGIRWARSAGQQLVGALVPAVLFGTLAVTGTWVLAPGNLDGWVLDWDVEPDRRASAEALMDEAEPGDVVAAPEPVGQALVMLSVDVRALDPEARYLRGSHATAEFDAAGRLFVTESVSSGLAPGREGELASALDRFSVDAVCLGPGLSDDPVAAVLADLGFEPSTETELCSILQR